MIFAITERFSKTWLEPPNQNRNDCCYSHQLLNDLLIYIGLKQDFIIDNLRYILVVPSPKTKQI